MFSPQLAAIVFIILQIFSQRVQFWKLENWEYINNKRHLARKYLAIIEWGWVGYEEFRRLRRVLSTEAEGRGG